MARYAVILIHVVGGGREGHNYICASQRVYYK